MAGVDHGQDLFRLTYVSRAVLPVLANFDATVEQILSVAIRNNSQLGLTGILLAHRGWFIQCLEGPRRRVSMTFTTIVQDARHAQIELLDGGPAKKRLFGDWSMCARTIGPQSAPVLDQLELAHDFDPFLMDGSKALALMQAIAKAQAAAAA